MHQAISFFVVLLNTCNGFHSAISLRSLRPLERHSIFEKELHVRAPQSRKICLFSVESEKGSTESGRLLAEQLRGVNLYLVGAMGSGKSSIGDALCRMLGSYTFVDTDTMIETVTNRTISEIFSQDGEDSFRDAESSVLEQIAAFVRLVVATGGGIVLKQRNWASLRNGVVVWINPSIDILQKRLTSDQANLDSRPLLKDEEKDDASPAQKIEHILENRRSLYEQADLSLSVTDPEETPIQTAERLVSLVLRFLADNPPKRPPSSS